MSHVTFPKPMRGDAMLARRARRAELTKHEAAEMDAAKKRDRGCRWPGCPFVRMNLTLHAAHLVHRGMGGNPAGDRTTRAGLITFCSRHHGMFDRVDIDVLPRTERGTDGPCDYYVTSPHTGRLEILYSESSIGVSVAVGA